MTNDRTPIPSSSGAYGSGVVPAIAYGADPIDRFVLIGTFDVSDAVVVGAGMVPDESVVPNVADLTGSISMAVAVGQSVPAGAAPPVGSVPTSWQLLEGPPDLNGQVPGIGFPYGSAPGNDPAFLKFTSIDQASGCEKSLLLFLRDPSALAHNDPGEAYLSFDLGHTWTACTDPSTTINFDGPPDSCPLRPTAIPIIIVRDDDKPDGVTIDGDVHLDASTMPGADTGAHHGHVTLDGETVNAAVATDLGAVAGANPMPVYMAAALKAFYAQGTLESVTPADGGGRLDDFGVPAGWVAVKASISAVVVDTGDDGFTFGIVAWVHESTGGGGPLDGEKVLRNGESFEFTAPAGIGLGGFGIEARAAGADADAENVILTYEIWAVPGHDAG